MTNKKLSLTAAAAAFGVSRETLKRALARAEIEVKDGAKFTVKQCHDALAGDVRGERARLLRAQANRTEMENAQLEGRLHSRDDVMREVWLKTVLPVKQALEAMPQQLAPLISADNPAAVEMILRDWLENLKAMMRNTPKKNEAEK